MKVPFVKQASDSDYTNIKHTGLNRGHLFPNCHAADDLTAKSTFTLTNVVPQKESFNSGSWSRMEDTVKRFMNDYCRDKTDNNKTSAYVLTGAVPGNNTLKKRVNIPSHMWTVVCCYHKTNKTFISKAHWAKNEDEGKNGKITTEITLDDLKKNLNSTWPNITLFNSCV